MFFTRLELSLRLDDNFAHFLNYVLDCVRQEVVERVDLLGHKPILMEESVYYFPGILLVNIAMILARVRKIPHCLAYAVTSIDKSVFAANFVSLLGCWHLILI